MVGQSAITEHLEMMYDASWQLCLQWFDSLFTPSLRAVLPGLGKRSLKAMDGLFAGSRTICQGDYRPDNLF